MKCEDTQFLVCDFLDDAIKGRHKRRADVTVLTFSKNRRYSQSPLILGGIYAEYNKKILRIKNTRAIVHEFIDHPSYST